MDRKRLFKRRRLSHQTVNLFPNLRKDALTVWGVPKRSLSNHLSISSTSSSTNSSSEGADIIFKAVKFITLENEVPSCTQIACKNNRIFALGNDLINNPNICTHITKIQDLGNVVGVPGFIESHAHPSMMGVFMEEVDVTPDATNSIELVLQALRKRADMLPEGSWVLGRGYDQGNLILEEDQRPLLASDLDQVSTKHYIKVVSNSGHTTYVNSLLLEKAGIGRNAKHETKSEQIGQIVLDSNGNPTGELQGAGSEEINRLQPKPKKEDVNRQLKLAALKLQSLGVTTVYDMMTQPASLKEYPNLAAGPKDEFPCRVRMYPPAGAFAPGQILSARTPAPNFGDDRLKMGGMKAWSDGSLQGYTGYLTKPYHKGAPCTCYKGYPYIEQPDLEKLCESVVHAGYQMSVHANGDMAIENTIDAFEKAMLKNINFGEKNDNKRLVIQHCQTPRPDQLKRMAKLNIVASFFANHVWYYGDAHRDLFLGEKRASRISPLAEATKAGMKWGLHSDAPITEANPLKTMWTVITRKTRTNKTLGADQCIDPETALKAYTINNAYLGFEENDKGSLKVGKLCDLAILSADPVEIGKKNPDAILDIKVKATILGGEYLNCAKLGITKSKI